MICENCNLPHDGTYGSGRFCCVKCSRGFATKANRSTINKLKSERMTQPPHVFLLTCKQCNSNFTIVTKRTRKPVYCSKECATIGSKPIIKASIAKLVESGQWSGWAKRKSDDPSYAEKYFIGLFNNEQIQFQREVKAGKWFIDFVVKNFAIEIDGKQHERPERAASDKIKDAYLSNNGFTVIRIKWANPCNAKGCELLYPQIEHMLKLIKDRDPNALLH